MANRHSNMMMPVMRMWMYMCMMSHACVCRLSAS